MREFVCKCEMKAGETIEDLAGGGLRIEIAIAGAETGKRENALLLVRRRPSRANTPPASEP